MNQYLYVSGSKVFYFLYLDFPLFACFDDRIADTGYRFSVRYLSDNECFVIHLFYFGSYPYGSATFAVIVFRYIDIAACLKIGIESEFFLMQVFYGCIAKFVEVMW